MCVNDTGCHFVLCRTGIDKTELQDLRSHFLFVYFGVCSGGGVASDMASCPASLSIADWRSGLKTEEVFDIVEGGRYGGLRTYPVEFLVRDFNFTRVKIVSPQDQGIDSMYRPWGSEPLDPRRTSRVTQVCIRCWGTFSTSFQ
jgi:hypothetical protein